MRNNLGCTNRSSESSSARGLVGVGSLLLLTAFAPLGHAQTVQPGAFPPPLPPAGGAVSAVSPTTNVPVPPVAERQAVHVPVAGHPLPGDPSVAALHSDIRRLVYALEEHKRTAEMLAIRQRNRSLIAGGASLFAAGYLGAVIGGTVFFASAQGSSVSRELSTERTASATLFIPVLGPFVSSIVYHDAPEWGLLWSMTDGFVQVGGVFMMAAGIYSNRRLPRPALLGTIAPVRTPTMTGLSWSGAF
ncbi:MAG TPA: hypothetical protein PKE31_00680 [Pseudomonadota bacterium]|nr:hypothetical protein [Pseudomonadota bacterium]